MTKWEGLVLESKCGKTKCGETIALARDGTIFAHMLGDGASQPVRELAQKVIEQLSDSTNNGSRPSKLVVKDRFERYDEEDKKNGAHITKTIELNMRLSQEKWDLIDQLWKRYTGPCSSLSEHALYKQQAIRWAAELYAIRQFVTGVIRGRLYKRAESHIDSQVAKWEDQWDTAYGNLVGEILGMQE